MGSYAAWQLGMSLPHVFAAMVPICGGGMYWNAERLKNVPVWAFHGADDTLVYPEESAKMVEAVNACGGNAVLTVYEGIGHTVWLDVYSDAAVFEWLLSHEKQREK
jgi:predicted peptidase